MQYARQGSTKFLRIAPLLTLLAATAAAGPASAADSQQPDRRPNVVLIMTDNHGAWTLGCYGNREIRTPHIDRLAKEGTLFTRAFASNPVCSPTRATVLTGLMPSQHGVHSYLVAGRLQIGPDAHSTLAEFTSLPEILKRAGYACGLVGKWHLGDNLRPQEGFEDYWITMPHGATRTFYGAEVIEGGRVRNEPQYLTDFWTRHAVKFLKQRAEEERPFFLFLAYNGPYALGRSLLEEGRNRHAAFYAEQTLPSFPREPAHPWLFNNRDYIGNPVSIRRVATEVSGVDDGVGTVLRSLEELGLAEDTLVVFTADQGWVGGHGGFFGMGDHTRPVTAREGMLRIPLIWRHPGRIAANARSDRLVANYDLMPTLLGYLDLGKHMPEKPKSPGRDFSAELVADTDRPKAQKDAGEKDAAEDGAEDEAVFAEYQGLRSIRTTRWRYVHRHPDGPQELFDLQSDPGEFLNLAGDPTHAEMREELKRRLDAFFAEYAEPKYDLWNDGGSQTRLLGGGRNPAGRRATDKPAKPGCTVQPAAGRARP